MRRATAFGIDLIGYAVLQSALLALTEEQSWAHVSLRWLTDVGFVVYRLLGAKSGGALSLGKHLLGLRITVSDVHSRVSWRRSFQREGALVLMLLPSFYVAASTGTGVPSLGTLTVAIAVLLVAGTWAVADVAVAWTHGGQSLHDRLAGTSVVRRTDRVEP
jgi:hypothetical protein